VRTGVTETLDCLQRLIKYLIIALLTRHMPNVQTRVEDGSQIALAASQNAFRGAELARFVTLHGTRYKARGLRLPIEFVRGGLRQFYDSTDIRSSFSLPARDPSRLQGPSLPL
jgi:hypothetical protein